MPTIRSSHHAFRRQNLLIEFAGLKYASPQGVYMSLSPQEPRLWWGVMFMRKGPYASAILKFTVLFPTGYPIHPPIITFLSDIYHPLVVPPSTPPPPPPPPISSSNTASPGKHYQQNAAHYNYNQNVSNLPPGSFSLNHGFPMWSAAPSPRASSSYGKKLPPNPPLTPMDGSSPRPPSSSRAHSSSVSSNFSPVPQRDHNILEVLYYLKSVFASQTVLDEIPPHLSVNLGAWRAWRSYRESGKDGGSESGAKVWLEKINACVAAGQSDGVLFGGLGIGRGNGGLGVEEMIRFLDITDEEYAHIKEMILQQDVHGAQYAASITSGAA